MSASEVARFNAAMDNNPEIIKDFPLGGDLSSLAQIANELGFSVTEQDFREDLEKSLSENEITTLGLSEQEEIAGAGYVYTSSNIVLGTNVAVTSTAIGLTQVAVATFAIVAVV